MAGFIFIFPYVLHVEYTDLGTTLGVNFVGVGLCSVKTENRDWQNNGFIAHGLITAAFNCICMVAAVLLYLKTVYKLEKRQHKLDDFEMKTRRREILFYGNPTYGQDPATFSLSSIHSDSCDVYRKFVEVKYLMIMYGVYWICWLPLVAINIAHQLEYKLERHHDAFVADVIHLSCTAVAFISPCVIPCVYFLWRRSLRPTARKVTVSESSDAGQDADVS